MENFKTITLADGRKVHVAESEDHIERLRSRYNDAEFDFTVHGSPEHITALKNAKQYHQTLQSAMREQHPEIFHEIERLQSQMDEISSDLQAITQHDVHLEANFGKYGYAANLRTHVRKEVKEENITSTMKIWKRPVIRQYFHKGLLWRASEKEEVASFELFVDLLYVGVLEVVGEHASEHPSASAFLRFCITLIPSYKIFMDIQTIVSWFETDDLVQRAAILLVLACLLGFTTNIFLADTITYTQLVGFYLAARFINALLLVWGAILIPMVKATLYGNVISIVVPAAVWIGSIYVEEPNRQALIWTAIFLDVALPSVLVMCLRGVPFLPKKWSKKIQDLFEFYPALNIEHKTERTGAFVSLVFGYSVLALLYQNGSSFGLNVFLGKALLGLLQAFCFNMIYFDFDGSYHELHAIRRKVWSAFIWLNSHLLFVLSFVIGGAGLSRLVLAHDVPTADYHDLHHHFEEQSLDHVGDALRWYYCGGLAVALFSMNLIAMAHLHRNIDTQRLSKRWRLAYRFLVGIVWLCLPAAGERLNSLHLISITAGMVVSIVALELYGVSCTGDQLLGSRKRCGYICDAEVRRRGSDDSSMETAVDPERNGKTEFILKDSYVEVQN